MDILSGDISVLVFKRMIHVDLEKVSIDGQMLKVLLELDGKKKLGQIAQAVGMSLANIRTAISKLIDLKLIQAAEGKASMLDDNFFDDLTDQLSQIAGPIAQVMVDDAIHEISNSTSKVPKNRAAEFLELIVRQIPEGTQRTDFLKKMMEKIRKS